MRPSAARRAPAVVRILVGLALVALVASCTDDRKSDTASKPAPVEEPVVIGIQDFGESEILAHVYGEALAAEGYKVEYKKLGGFRDLVYKTFDSGDMSFTAEYVGSAAEFLAKAAGQPTGIAGSDAQANAEALRPLLAARSLHAFAVTDAIDSNSLVVTKAFSDARGITKISQLTPDLRLGGPPDCGTNPFCTPGLQRVYGIDLTKNFVSLDGGGPKTKTALEGNQIDVAVIFSSDSALATKPWVTLEDDKKLFLADAVIPVATKKLADAGGEALESLVDSVSAKLTTQSLVDMNKSFDVDKEDAADIAKAFLQEQGILSK